MKKKRITAQELIQKLRELGHEPLEAIEAEIDNTEVVELIKAIRNAEKSFKHTPPMLFN